jgi:hypothetical protein
MKVFPRFLILFACVACGLVFNNAYATDGDDVCEAVFRYQFTNNAAHGWAAAEHRITVFFLSVGEKGGDPSDALMKRFAGHQPPVRKCSGCSTKKFLEKGKDGKWKVTNDRITIIS